LHVLMSLCKEYLLHHSGPASGRALQGWVASFKGYTVKQARKKFGITMLWQKNFYEHIVRREESLLKIAEYILDNPVRKGIAIRRENYPYSGMVDPLPFNVL
jgi:hypothetical protein